MPLVHVALSNYSMQHSRHLILLMQRYWLMLIGLESHEGFGNPHTKFHLDQTIASAIFEDFYFNYILKVKHFYTIST